MTQQQHTLLEKCISEVLATAIFIWLGNSGITNHVLKKTKGSAMSFGFVALQFGMAVSFASAIFSSTSAIMNPAGMLCLYIAGVVHLDEAIVLSIAQFVGAFIGGGLVFVTYYPHFQMLPDHDPYSADHIKGDIESDHPITSKLWSQDALSCFANRPAVYHLPSNFICEFLCSFILQFGIHLIGNRIDSSVTFIYSSGLQSFLNGMYVFLLIAALGGPTGFTANPARDYGPRMAHYFLPIRGKTDSQLLFGLWIVLSNFLGGALAGYLYPFFKI